MFRGQADATWDVLPSIMRGNKNFLDFEKDIIREIISRYPYDFDQDQTTFDRLSRMQHYGIATRLLDITTNPLAALFFSLEQFPDQFLEPDGCVLYFDGPLDRRKFFDSDTVSCIANLCSLNSDEKAILATTTARNIAEFNALKPARRLLQFIKAEKPYFEPEIRARRPSYSIRSYPKTTERSNNRAAWCFYGIRIGQRLWPEILSQYSIQKDLCCKC